MMSSLKRIECQLLTALKECPVCIILIIIEYCPPFEKSETVFGKGHLFARKRSYRNTKYELHDDGD